MCRLRKIGILVPSPYYVDLDSNWLYMEQIPGNTLQQLLADDQQTSQPGEQLTLQDNTKSVPATPHLPMAPVVCSYQPRQLATLHSLQQPIPTALLINNILRICRHSAPLPAS